MVGCSSKSKKQEELPPPTEAPAKSGRAEKQEGMPAPVEAPEVVSGRESGPAPQDPRYRSLAQAVRSNSKSPQAIQDEAAKILGTSANDPVALNALAILQLRRDRPKAAKLLLARAIEKNPPSASLTNNLGVVLLAEGEQEAAIGEFKKALRIEDRHPEASGNLGSIYARGGDLMKAYPLLETAYQANRSNVLIATNYGIALRARKEFETARKVYEEAYKSNSSDVNLVLNYAIVLIEDLNRPKEGLDLVYRVKFLENQRKDVLTRVNALEKKAKSELK